MREREEFEDHLVSDIVKKGRHTLPSPDFEEQVMLKILSDSSYKEEVSNKLNLSFIFFVVGSILGICLAVVILVFFDTLLGFNPKVFSILFLFVISVISILNIDNYVRLLGQYSLGKESV